MNRRTVTAGSPAFPWRPALLALAITTALSTPVLAAGRLDGQISNPSGLRLEGAQVRLIKPDGSVVALRSSGRDGRFQFINVEAGTYTLEVQYVGADTERQSVTITDSTTTSLPLTLGQVERILVLGQAGATSRALNQQKDADNIATVASADAIGQFPDSNASESLQRLPGMSIERDQGEGRFVRVRGMAPDLNAVTYAGTHLPAPESDRRAVALDVIPSDLLESLEVVKTLTPDMDADSLGGAVEIKSLSAFDRDDRYYNISAEGSYNDQEEKTSPKLAASWSDTFDVGDHVESLGVALAASWYKRKFGTDNVETGGGWDVEEGKLEEFEERDYQVERERLGLAANIDFRPDDDNQYFLRTLYSEFDDSETRNAIVTEFDEAQSSGETGAATVSRTLKSREEDQTIAAVILGGSNRFDDWLVSYQAGISRAEEDLPFGISGATFEQSLDDGVGYTDDKTPHLTGPASLYDSDAYELDKIKMIASDAIDREHNAKIDISRDLTVGTVDGQLKFGAKASRRHKTNDEEVWSYKASELGLDDSSALLSAFSCGNVDYGFGRFGDGICASSIYNLVNRFDRADFREEVDSTINDYTIDEDVDAGYLMGRADIGDLRVVTGVRYEATRLDADGSAYDSASDAYTDRQVSHDYSNWLPSLHLRYSISDDLIVRGAWTNTLVRPTFGQLAPGYLLEEDDGDLEASFGNPQLKPITSANLDFGVEYYAGGIGVISAMLFYKDIDNFIYEADLAGSGDYADFKHAETFANGDSATLMGLELNYVKQFKELPAPWNGLLLSANGTWTDADASISWYDDGVRYSRDLPFPSQSERTANIALGYENEHMSVRLSAAYQSKFLMEVGELDDASYDSYADDHLQVDLTGKWFITDGIQVYVKAQNLNNEPYYAYVGNDSLNYQYERYGRTWLMGVQFTNF